VGTLRKSTITVNSITFRYFSAISLLPDLLQGEVSQDRYNELTIETLVLHG